MTDLIARLESATEGSRELDCAIYTAVTGEEAAESTGTEWLQANLLHLVPAYTQSVDDAMQLLLEGWTLANLWDAENPKDRPWCGCALRCDFPYTVVKSLGCKTLPLAMSAAALKAREAQS